MVQSWLDTIQSQTWLGMLQTEVAGNALWRVLLFFILIVLASMLGKFTAFLLYRAAATQRRMDTPEFALNIKKISSFTLDILAKESHKVFLFVATSLGLRLFQWPTESLEAAMDDVASTLVVIAVAFVLYKLVSVVEFWFEQKAASIDARQDNMLIPLARKTLKVTIVFFAVFQCVTIFSDKPLTSVLAGLGVGGLAVALAAQETLKNLFGSVVLFADKAFEVGDRVVIDETDGPVEEVGFRSTKIRTLEGHLVTIPNGELANKSIRNVGKRPHIRRLFRIGVTYDMDAAAMEQALTIVREILKDHEGINPDFPPRVFFEGFGDFSLNILVIYWYHPPDYWAYLAMSEKVNQQIYNQFEQAGIEFAFPTQTVHLENGQIPEEGGRPAGPDQTV